MGPRAPRRPPERQEETKHSRARADEWLAHDGIITPNGLFYERHHGGIPPIDPASHRLIIYGLIERPLLLTIDELRRFPTQSRIYFLECPGNPGLEAIKQGKTASDLIGLASCCEWTGVRLKTILDEVGVKPDAR